MTRLAAVAAGGLLVAACGGSPSPTETASPSPSAEPTPDLAQAFVARLASPGFAAASEVTGTFEVGTKQIDLRGTIQGEYVFSAGDYSSSLEIEIAGVSTEQDELAVDGERFSSTDGGPWIRQEPPADSTADEQTLTKVLTEISNLEDAGEVEKFGRTLHQLAAPDPVELDAASLGLTDPSISDVSGTMEFFAEADGTPAGFSVLVTWSQVAPEVGDMTAEMVMNFEFTDLEGPFEIEPPEEPWGRYTDDDWAYTIAHPESWTFDDSEEFAELFLPSDASAYFGVAHVVPLPELRSQAAYEADSQAQFASQGASALATVRWSVGPEDGQLTTYLMPSGIVIMNVAVFHGGIGYDIQVGASGEDTAALTFLFEAVMSTFAFTE